MNGYFSVARAAATCAVVVGATLLNSNSSAQPFIAADYATNSTYASGWTQVFAPNDRGQNGGYGFGPWSMWHQVGVDHPGLTAMDHTSPYDPFKTAWTLCNPYGLTPNTWPQNTSPELPTSASYADSAGTCVNPPTGYTQFGPGSYDLSQAGRAVPNGEVWDPVNMYYVP